MTDEDAHLWDSNRRGSTDAFNREFDEWKERDWMTWLAANLTFPPPMEQWDLDYIDMEEAGHITFKKDGSGGFPSAVLRCGLNSNGAPRRSAE
jgi:hypothetical protein